MNEDPSIKDLLDALSQSIQIESDVHIQHNVGDFREHYMDFFLRKQNVLRVIDSTLSSLKIMFPPESVKKKSYSYMSCELPQSSSEYIDIASSLLKYAKKILTNEKNREVPNSVMMSHARSFVSETNDQQDRKDINNGKFLKPKDRRKNISSKDMIYNRLINSIVEFSLENNKKTFSG